MPEQYIYFLKRTDPLHERGEKDKWSTIGVFGPERALKQLESEVGCKLKLFKYDDEIGEFELEQYIATATQAGSQQGGIVETFRVERSRN